MKTVLIVDDDRDFREALGSALTVRGFGVREAASGREALDQLKEHWPLPDALLIDLMMPGMDGWQLLKVLKGDPMLARIPSAVVSASRNLGHLPDSVSVLPKPCDLSAFLRFLEEVPAAAPG